MDGKRQPGDPDDVMMQQDYPSPTVDGAEAAPYYHTPHGLKQDFEHHLVSEGPHDGQEAQDHQGHSTPHRHQSRASVSAEELQLAAQLTQGLAPIMAAHNQAQDGQQQAQEADMQGQEHNFQDQDHADPDLQEHLQNQLHNDDHNLQSMLPHVDERGNFVPSQAGSHLQPHIPLDHMGQQFQIPDAIPPRKRSKVSRACDECRRKKIKCDAVSDAADEPCSNCRRSSARCLFSRIPQKRGPSKGYIKELADRIHSIEGKLGAGAIEALDGVSRRASADAFPSPVPGDESRKRPFSNVSAEPFPAPAVPRQSAWGGAEHRPIQPYQSPAARSPYSANGLAPRAIGPKADDDGPKVDDDAVMDESQLEQLRGLDEEAFEFYLATVHPAFPVLSTDRNRVHALMAPCPIILREAFLEAFYALTRQQRAAQASNLGDIRTANRLLADWESESEARTTATRLLELQTLLLMAIEIDSHGPPSLRGLHGGPTKSSVLGRAVGMAYSMGLHHAGLDPVSELEMDFDGDDRIGLRAWWSLVMLDRWNAIGTATPALISNDTAVVLPGLKSIVGEAGYLSLYLCSLLGNFVPMSLSPPKELSSGLGPVIGSWMNSAMEGFRMSFPPGITPFSNPVVHLSYWHCRLLAYLFSPAALSSDILWAAGELVGVMSSAPHHSSPLDHHFTGLAALTLAELVKVDKTRDEADRLLKDLLEVVVGPTPWEEAIRAHVADRARPSTSSGLDSQGLQHLADLATATTGKSEGGQQPGPVFRTTDDYENAGFDPRPMLQAGYLNVFAPAPPHLQF